MPAIVTHDLFGRAVADDVADLMNFRSVDERDAYLLGNQGPDPLFYLVAHPLMAKWSRKLRQHHARRLSRAAAGCHARGGRPARGARARHRPRLRGRLHEPLGPWTPPCTPLCTTGKTASPAPACRALTPPTRRRSTRRSSATGTRWPSSASRARPVAEWRPYREVLVASPEVLSCVDKLYFYVALWVFGQPVDPQAFSVSVHEFRLLQRLFYSAGGGKRLALGGVERLLHARPLLALPRHEPPRAPSGY